MKNVRVHSRFIYLHRVFLNADIDCDLDALRVCVETVSIVESARIVSESGDMVEASLESPDFVGSLACII